MRSAAHHARMSLTDSGVSRPPLTRAIRRLKNSESQSRNWQIALFMSWFFFLKSNLISHHTLRSAHRSGMHSRQILPDNSQGEQLRPGEYGDDGGQEGKSGRRAAFNQIAPDDVDQHQEA